MPVTSNFSSQKGFSHILLIVLVIVLILTGGVLYLNFRQSTSQTTIEITPSPIPAPSIAVAILPPMTLPTPAPHKDWHTYTDSYFKFSFKYPNSWKEPTITNNPRFISASNKTILIRNIAFREDNGITLSIDVQENDNYGSNQSYVDSRRKIHFPDTVDFQTINVKGIEAGLVTYEPLAYGPNPISSSLFFADKNITYYIILDNSKTMKSEEPLLRQIMETFEWINY